MTEKFDREYIIKRLENKKAEGRDTIVTQSKWLQPNTDLSVAVNVGEHPKNHFSEYHTHSFFEINYVYKGNGVNCLENEIIDMKQGDVVIMYPGTFHTLYADEDSLIYNFIVNKEWLCREARNFLSIDNPIYSFLNKLEDTDFYKYVVCPFNGNEKVLRAAEGLIKRFGELTFSRFILSEVALLEFLTAIMENADHAYLSPMVKAKDQKIIGILMYVADNFATVTLEELSEKFFYSKTHICRLFLAHTGKSFNQSLMQMKINHACKYLKNTDMSVEDIARAVGYDSVEYFQRLFKNKMGITPGEYRRSGVADNVLC